MTQAAPIPVTILEQVPAAEQASGPPRGSKKRHASGGIESVALIADQLVPARSVDAFLNLMGLAAGPRLLRLKGLAAVAEDPDRPLVIHAVGHTVYPVRQLDAWLSEDRRTRMVAITSNLDPGVLKSLFASLTRRSSRKKLRTGLAGIIAAALACGPAIPRLAHAGTAVQSGLVATTLATSTILSQIASDHMEAARA